jgi:hypothetical protein
MTDTNGQAGAGAREIPIEPDEIDRMADQAAQFDPRGRVTRTVITPKDYLAGVEPFDLISGQRTGALVTLGTLAGKIYAVEKKENEWQGKKLESYWLIGQFEAFVAATGEIFTAPQAILPKSYGMEVANAFRDLGVTSAAMGVTIALRVSGRSIPYNWEVTNHLPAPAQREISAISAMLQKNFASSPLKTIAGDFDRAGQLTNG